MLTEKEIELLWGIGSSKNGGRGMLSAIWILREIQCCNIVQAYSPVRQVANCKSQGNL
jgi:hypothetical protein